MQGRDDLQKKVMQQSDIAIVGMACIFPKAPNLHTFWQNIVAGVDAIGDPPEDSLLSNVFEPHADTNDRIYCKRGGYLGELPPFKPADYGVMPVALDGAEPEHFLALKVAHDALDDAGFPDKPINKQRTEVLLGRGTFVNRGYMTAMQHSVVIDQTVRLLKELQPDYSEDNLKFLKKKLKAQLPPFTPETAPGLCHNVMAGLIANRLDLQGRNLVLDAACASCLLALEIAIDDLSTDKCDAAIVGGVQISTHAPIHMIFTQLGALSRQPHLRPFDKDADGTMLGEGIGMMVLKRLPDAVADGHRIYAVIKGIGSSSDGKGSGLLAPRLEGEELALKRAYDAAQLSPDTVDLIEAHGTGIPLGDVTEMKALTTVFGQRNDEPPRCAIGTVKSMIGHLIPAAGIAGMIKTALALHHKILPPTLCCDTPNPDLQIDKTPFYINTSSRPWIHSRAHVSRRAGVSAFGFGGINAHVALEEYEAEKKDEEMFFHAQWDNELFVFDAPSRQKLVQRCQTILKQLTEQDKPSWQCADLAYTVNAEYKKQGIKLTIVASSIDELVKKLGHAIVRLQDPGRTQIKDRSGIYFFETPLGKSGKLAFLFPGEGSQYVNMLTDLCLHFPQARECFDLLDKAYADHQRKVLPSQYIFPPTDEEKEKAESKIFEMDGAVDAVSTANRALFKIVTCLGIKADAMAGHSSGELAALEASGAVKLTSEEDVLYHIQAGNRIIETMDADNSIPEGRLLAVGGVKKDAIDQVLGSSDDFLTVAMDNCPHQFVLCGTEQSIQKAEKKLKREGAICQQLPFHRAYHTERFKQALTSLKKFYDGAKFKVPRLPLYSCLTADRYPENPESIKQLAIEQWTNPVQFRQTIEKMYDDGVRVFLELGPRANLTGFVNDILKGKPFLGVATNVHHRSSITQLNHSLAMLVASGVEVNLHALYRHRRVEKIDFTQSVNESLPQGEVKLSLDLPLLQLDANGVQHLAGKSESYSRSAPETSVRDISNTSAKTSSISATGGSKMSMQEYFRTMEQFLEMQESLMQKFLAQGREVSPDVSAEHQVSQFHERETIAKEEFTPFIVRAEREYKAGHHDEKLADHSETKLIGEGDAKNLLLSLVSERTGYPLEMLDLKQNLEADLGIDSIKRVEILGALAKQLGPFDDDESTTVNQLKTLGEIIHFISDRQEQSVVVEGKEDTVESDKCSVEEEKIEQKYDLQKLLLSLVSERTGYPEEMLDLNQNLEAELGIDSIKRVEILGALAKHIGPLEDEKADQLSRLKTLGEIIQFFENQKSDYLERNKKPFVGEITKFLPGKEIEATRQVNSDLDIFLHDHNLGGNVSQVDTDLSGLMVMPFSMSLEVMAEAAEELCSGKHLVGIRNIKAHDWLAMDQGQLAVSVKGTMQADSLKVGTQLCISDSSNIKEQLALEGLMVFADQFPDAPAMEDFSLQHEKPFSINTRQLYPKILFHGPVFQNVKAVNKCAENGIEAVLQVDPDKKLVKQIERPHFLTWPLYIDAVGQVVGIWANEILKEKYVIFPAAVEEIRFYAESQPDQLVCRVRVEMQGDTGIYSNIDLLDNKGNLLCQLKKLHHRRINMPEILHHFRGDRETLLSDSFDIPIEGFDPPENTACCRFSQDCLDLDGADGPVLLSVIAEIILSKRERKIWAAFKGPQKRRTEWLLGRLVGKEAVRRLLRKQGEADVWSADIEIIPDAKGKPEVHGAWLKSLGKQISLSLSHTDGMVTGLAALMPHGAVGIDLEKLRPMDENFAEMAFSEPERKKFFTKSDQDNELALRLWCAKEAAAKAVGTGLTGNPLDFRIDQFNSDSGEVDVNTVRVHSPEHIQKTTEPIHVMTWKDNDFIGASAIYTEGDSLNE